jgi:hypothetical protein
MLLFNIMHADNRRRSNEKFLNLNEDFYMSEF